MSMTLTAGAVSVPLHNDLQWSDEFAWNPVAQTVERTITGAALVSTALIQGGRPITLEPEDESSAWMPRADVEALKALAATPGVAMVLTIRGQAHNVMFRHQDVGFSARPVVHYNDAVAEDWYLCVIRLMEI